MEYQGGKEDWGNVAKIAALCGNFTEDDEDEQVADELQSCSIAVTGDGPVQLCLL